ncbi:MAG: hypothetical protein LLG14_07095, partial [Nocardiaceae bacterium]|nr:hypothetical protein [Nocardiaceae bacterium]
MRMLVAIGMALMLSTTGCSTEGKPRSVAAFQLPEGESLFIRTDFSDDSAWRETLVQASKPWDVGGVETSAAITTVSERRFEGMTVAKLEKLIAAPPPYYLFLVDKRTLTDPEHPIVVVDTGRMNESVKGFPTFRVIPRELPSVTV